MFNKIWFLKHEKLLLWLLNTPLIKIWFRWILRINGERSSIGNRKIIHIEPNAIWWKNKGKKITAEFRTHNKFAKRLYYAFKPLWYFLHYWDILFANNFNPNWNLGFDSTGDLFPVAGANSPVDGDVKHNAANSTWATIRDGAGTGVDVTGVNTSVFLAAGTTTDTWTEIQRSIMCFDASSISDDATKDSAIFSLYGGGKSNGISSEATHIAGATPANTNNLVSADYAQVQRTTFGNVTYASFTVGAYNDITLNASGLTNISLTAVSKFSAQHAPDINNSPPAWVNGANNQVYWSSADTAGTTQDPKLVVTYTPPPSSRISGLQAKYWG